MSLKRSSNIFSYSNPASLRDRSVAGDAPQSHATTRSQSTFNRSINFFPLLLFNPDVIALESSGTSLGKVFESYGRFNIFPTDL
jgi:hypothetical protein